MYSTFGSSQDGYNWALTAANSKEISLLCLK